MTISADIKRGDVVQLKSGGPEMTVNGIGTVSDPGGAYSNLVCVWFNDLHVHHGQFAADAVVKIDRPSRMT